MLKGRNNPSLMNIKTGKLLQECFWELMRKNPPDLSLVNIHIGESFLRKNTSHSSNQ